jgi:subtilisin family serine protease
MTLSNLRFYFKAGLVGMSFVVSNVSQAGLVSATKSSIVNDSLGSYQWALKTEGQSVIRDVTDIRSQTVTAEAGKASDVDADPRKLTTAMKRVVVVAVLDSGLDVHHPDLIKNIYRNDAECLNGAIPFKPTEDKDGNGFMGDCSGWNFTVGTDSNVQNNPEDDLGHGTHVAGIIAAMVDNQLGVSGISNNIRVLPLKVTSAADGKGGPNGGTAASIALTGRVIKAIQYAIKMKVDVINISMGWPAATDSAELRAVFTQAMDVGITIVAAAGNNNNTSFNFPCSYEGVLCVAATGIDNQLTKFSNFGGQVDLSAPGEEILSTYPTALKPVNFSIDGYETLNGTSQAAPYVSAAVAVLKGTYPGIPEDEIKARLLLATQDLSVTGQDTKNKFLQFGTLKIQKALDLKAQGLVTPQFKKLSRVLFSKNNNQVSFNLDFVNYWQAQAGVRVQVESLSPNFLISSGQQAALDFSRGEHKQLALMGQIRDLREASEVKIRVQVQTPQGFARSFVHVFDLSRTLDGDASVIHLPMSLQTTTNPDVVMKSLLTVSDPTGVGQNPDYYWSEQQAGSLRVHFLQSQGRGYQEMTLNLPEKSLTLLNLTKVPMPGGKSGYWIGTVATGGEPKSKILHYQLLDQRLQAVPTAGLVDFTPETVVLDKDGTSSLQFAVQGSGPTATVFPLFITNGNIPKADKNPDPFQFETSSSAKRVFYLKPVFKDGRWIYQTRNFDNYLFKEKIRSQLGLKYQDDLLLIGLLPQSKNDLDRIRILYSYGSQALQRFAVVETQGSMLDQHNFRLTRADFTSAFISSGVMAPVTDLSQEVTKNAFASFAVFLTPILSQNFYLQASGAHIDNSFDLKASSPQDLLISYIQSFRRGEQYFTFAQSKSNLILQVNSDSGAMKRMENSIHRATWPGVTSTELLYPAYIKAGQQWSPAIYVDATQMYSNNIYYWVVNRNDELVAPAQFNINIPTGCRPLTPQKFSSVGTYGSVLLCKNANQELELQILPLLL